jgi:beta-phosphoglucomutase-like phosphatase (HAD superfamily)
VRDADEPRPAILDRDGVLVDSEAHHHAAWHRLCREEGDILGPAKDEGGVAWPQAQAGRRRGGGAPA